VVVEAVVDNSSTRPSKGYVEANGYVSMPAGGTSRVVGDWLRIPDNLTTTGPVTVWVYLSPRNNVHNTDGLTYAVSLDGQPPQRVNVTTATGADDTAMNKQWERNTSDNVNGRPPPTWSTARASTC